MADSVLLGPPLKAGPRHSPGQHLGANFPADACRRLPTGSPGSLPPAHCPAATATPVPRPAPPGRRCRRTRGLVAGAGGESCPVRVTSAGQVMIVVDFRRMPPKNHHNHVIGSSSACDAEGRVRLPVAERHPTSSTHSTSHIHPITTAGSRSGLDSAHLRWAGQLPPSADRTAPTARATWLERQVRRGGSRSPPVRHARPHPLAAPGPR